MKKEWNARYMNAHRENGAVMEKGTTGRASIPEKDEVEAIPEFKPKSVFELVTAEAVRKGHPDKCCDQIADNILDEILKQDPNAHAAIEVMATRGKILIAGEVSGKANVEYGAIAADTLDSIGYDWSDLCETEDEKLDIELRINAQSGDIANAVANPELHGGIGAGDQGIVIGYATDENDACMPWPVLIAQDICRRLDTISENDERIGKDGKTLVGMIYENDVPKKVHNVIVSVQHAKDADSHEIHDLVEKVVRDAIPEEFREEEYDLTVNPSGSFVKGGPVADTGLTGRKLAVDHYGPVAHIGGGALSGKDGTKVDRSGAYAARWIAVNLVRAGLCRRCEITLNYAIGNEYPESISIDTFGTGEVPDGMLIGLVGRTFDTRVSSMIDRLKLRETAFGPLAAYGHFGRTDLDLPWEKADMQEELMQSIHRTIKEGIDAIRGYLDKIVDTE